MPAMMPDFSRPSPPSLARITSWCGPQLDITETISASKVKASIIAECPLALECRTRQRISLGSHDLFIAEILAVQAREDVLDAQGHLNLDAVNALGFYPSIGGKPEYRALGPKIGHFGVSAEKKRQG